MPEPDRDFYQQARDRCMYLGFPKNHGPKDLSAFVQLMAQVDGFIQPYTNRLDYWVRGYEPRTIVAEFVGPRFFHPTNATYYVQVDPNYTLTSDVERSCLVDEFVEAGFVIVKHFEVIDPGSLI